MDLFYPLRTGENEELRYSLRSVCENLPHDRVFVAGGPDWLTNVEQIGFDTTGDKWADLSGKFCAAVADPDISDPFVLFNDDFFVMEPVAEIPTRWRADLAAHMRSREAAGNDREWAGILRNTYELIGDCNSYVNHIPVVIHKTIARELIPLFMEHPRVEVYTVYSNYAQVGGARGRDAKVDFLTRVPAAFWSSEDDSFAGPRGDVIRERFTERCRYEA